MSWSSIDEWCFELIVNSEPPWQLPCYEYGTLVFRRRLGGLLSGLCGVHFYIGQVYLIIPFGCLVCIWSNESFNSVGFTCKRRVSLDRMRSRTLILALELVVSYCSMFIQDNILPYACVTVIPHAPSIDLSDKDIKLKRRFWNIPIHVQKIKVESFPARGGHILEVTPYL